MSKPTTIGTLTRVADDPKAPVALRVQALNALEHPQVAMLLRIMRHSKSPKLRAIASLKYVAETERKAAKKKHATSAIQELTSTTNLLGLKQ
jgi:hypothetical protein